MATETISTTINQEIVLGGDVYLNPLIITSTGALIMPTPSLAVQATSAIDVTGSNASISNYGVIISSILPDGSVTTPAINAVSALTLNNYGTISGASGIYLRNGGDIINNGTIIGQETQGSTGVGVLLSHGELQNFGTVFGGNSAVSATFATVINAQFGVIAGVALGVELGQSGYLNNIGVIYSSNFGLCVDSGGSANNSGVILGSSEGIKLLPQSTMTNSSAGSVYSLNIAVEDQAAYFLNEGVLEGNDYGLKLSDNGNAVNKGIILSQKQAVYITTSIGMSPLNFLNNFGYIYGLESAVTLRAGTVENSGTIEANDTAVNLIAGTSLENSGQIYGGNYGLQLIGGTVTNSGLISSGADGIRINNGSVTNSGEISGLRYAVYGTSFSLTVDPSAIFKGAVLDKSKSSILNLSGLTTGTLGGLGTQLDGFDTIKFEDGAHWLISGTTGALAAGEVIVGFTFGDTIALTGFTATSDTFIPGKGLILDNEMEPLTLDITGNFSTSEFSVIRTNTTSIINLQNSPPCFVTGTRILTPQGEIPVELLEVGDTVITYSGDDKSIVWRGKRKLNFQPHTLSSDVQPICITAGALAEDVPTRDLWLSPGHALFIEDVLVPANLLINHLNVFRGAQNSVTYYHLELKEHAVIFAENASVESYLDTGNRTCFDNVDNNFVLHPAFSELVRHKRSCAPLLVGGDQLDEIRQRILLRYSIATRTSKISPLNYYRK